MKRALVLVVALCGAVGCSPQPDTSHCTAAPASVVSDLESSLTKKGVLRHAYSSTVSGVQLISAELHLASDAKARKGNVLTWAYDGTTYRSVDGYARESSSLPAAHFDVRHAGVYASRACAASKRG